MPEIFDQFEDKERPHATRVWITREADKDQSQCPEAMMNKLEYCAETGFEPHENGPSLRLRKNGVWRFGIHKYNFRWLGFYEREGDRTSFIIVDFYKKNGKKLDQNRTDRAISMKGLKYVRVQR